MIEVGEYVRLKNGKIIKFKKFSTSRYSRYRGEDLQNVKTIIDFKRSHYKYDNIVKHSKNIIDLIEVGDYVNGKEVSINTKEYLVFKNVGSVVYSDTVLPEDIETIVTKEQMKSIEYRLEDN